MKTAMLIVGLLMLVSGLVWAAQGMGWLMWPKSSFMLQDMKWTYIGGTTALLGLAAVVMSRRR